MASEGRVKQRQLTPPLRHAIVGLMVGDGSDGQLDELDDAPPQWLRVGIAVLPPTPSASYHETAGPSAVHIDAFCHALASRLGIAVTAQSFSDYRALLAAINRGDADLAWLPPLVALRSASAGRTLPIALPIRGGTAWYSTALFTRVDSPVRSLRELYAQRVAWVDRQSTSGYLVIRAWLRSQNINLSTAFASEQFFGSHQAVVQAVLNSQADVGATFAHLDPAMQHVIAGGWCDDAVQVFAFSGPIPNDVIAASIRLPVPTIRQVRDALVQQDDALRRATSALFDATGFIAAESRHMAPLTSLLKHLDDTGRRRTSIFPPPRR